MVALPAALPVRDLPNIEQAKLPATYEHAKQALAECVEVDECKGWSDRAAAMATYARMAQDEDLLKQAIRVQAWALRRAGELLATFDARGGDRSKSDGAVISAPSQREVATDAGFSERQRVTASRLARIPEPDFAAHVESDAPPTVTKLAEMGTQRREPPAPPPHMVRATHAWGTLNQFAEWCGQNLPEEIAQGIYPHEVAGMRDAITAIRDWMDRFINSLEG